MALGDTGVGVNFGPSVAVHAGRFLKFFFDNNVSNWKRCAHLKESFKTSSNLQNIKLLVNSPYYPSFNYEPLIQQSVRKLFQHLEM